MKPIRHLIAIVFLLCGLTALGSERGYDRNDLVGTYKYNETKDKEHWHNIIQLLPTSYNQMRTVTLNYEVLINIYYARKSHKLAEWHTLCDAIANLPYAKELILIKE